MNDPNLLCQMWRSKSAITWGIGAPMTKRTLAATADGFLVAIALFYYRSWGSPLYLIAGAAYLLLRDAVAGRSVGKFLFGLVVINLETGRPCGWRASISRNALLLLPGANVVAAFLETSTIVRENVGARSKKPRFQVRISTHPAASSI